MIFKFDEAKAGKDAPENLVMTTITITSEYEETDNPHRNIPQAIKEQMVEFHAQALKGTVQTIKKLERLVEQYPRVPALYNYLSIAYVNHGNTVKFDKLNDLMVTRFPGYSVSRINQATRHIVNKDFDKAEEILGNSMELTAFLPNRSVFHVSEVAQFYETTVRFFLRKRQFDVAESRLELLKDISKNFNNFHNDRIKQLEDEKADIRETIRYENYVKFQVAGARKPWVVEQEKMPNFVHPEIQWLYENDFELPKEKIEHLLALPRITLIADLHKVLDDAMARYDFFQENDLDENQYFFPCHAIVLLGELAAKESLPHALNLLRQDDEWTGYWFSDMVTEIFPVLFYKILGDNDWYLLKNYLLEPNNDTFQRMAIPKAVTIAGYHHPEKRQKAIDFLEDILNDFYDNRQKYQDIIDTDLNEAIVANLIELESKASLPLIEKLFEADLLQGDMSGDLEEIKIAFSTQEQREFDFAKLPTVFELYEKMAAWHKPMPEGEHAALLEKIAANERELEENKRELAKTKQQYEHLIKQPMDVTPKVGRNEPCPCGSGKKYKKCCGA
jgi:hypothetical protein